MKWVFDEDWRIQIAATELARKAVAIRPDVSANWERLAGLFLQLERGSDAVETLERATQHMPANGKLSLMLAHSLQQAGRAAESLQILRSLPPDLEQEGLERYRLELLMFSKDRDEATQAATRMLALDPTSIPALDIYAKDAHAKGDIGDIVEAARRVLGVRPHDPGARYELAVALARQGHAAEARALIDTDACVLVEELAVPSPYRESNEFEAALVEEILDDPTLRPDPLEKATRSGVQTLSGLPHGGGPAIPALLASIRDAIDRRVGPLISGGWIAPPPAQARLSAWAVSYSAGGYQLPHIHANGWLSGVYYVSAPDLPPGEREHGALRLGAVKIGEADFAPPWEVVDLPAKRGNLVLFPPYLPHATTPASPGARRISVAFDVMRS